MSNARDLLNNGNANQQGGLAKAIGLGSLVAGEKNYMRQVSETLTITATVPSAPTYKVLQLLYVETFATGAPAPKAPGIRGATPSAGQAAPNAGGTAIVFNAETTGSGTANITYLTSDPPLVNGKAVATTIADLPGYAGP